MSILRSGFVTFVGRPNVGKSTLLNSILGEKVTIVSDKPQTTRTAVRGVLTRGDVQIVFVDTPGFSKPRTALGERLNANASGALHDVDAACLVLDATAEVGRGDRFVAELVPKDAIVVLNKIDAASKNEILLQLTRASSLGFEEYFPVSARTGEGVPALVEALAARLPEGPAWYPEEVVRDTPEDRWVAELVREQLLAVLREELPHSVACRVVEEDGARVRVEILVERESQKGIVIGKGGLVLKEVGSKARAQLPEGTYLELVVKVEADWQRRPNALERLGY
ncbi:MAG: GTPase Era [Acidimicrobiia bacterium]|nr:GTPase Era [Acidimicrobiia bacterium]